MTLRKNIFKKFTFVALAAFFTLTMSSLAWGQTIYDSFADGNFTANPVWGGTTGTWTVVANSDAAAGAMGSSTVRLSAAATTGTDYLTSQVSSFGGSQEWGFWIGRRSQAFTAANQQYFWLYANEANLNSATVDGYRLAIGDDTGGDDIRLEYIVNGAVNATIITSSGTINNGLTDIGFLVRVTRSSTGAFQLFTSALPTANGAGAIATDIPNSTNATVNQGTGTNNSLVPTANGYLGLAALHSTGGNAIVAAEFDQIYFTPTNPTVSLSVDSSTGSEAAQTVVTVTATASSAVANDQTVSLGVTGTGITGGDYNLSNTTITILSGQTIGSVTFTVVDDALVEGTETATLTISNPSSGITLGTPITQDISITDNDVAAVPSFAINDITVIEGDTGTTNAVFTVTKTNANGSASTVNFTTVADTATAGTDYTTTSGSLSFADGETSKTITVPVVGDYNIESNETFFVNLTAGTNATIGDGQGVGTINNDDAAGTVQFSTTNYSTLENNGTLTFTVTRTGGLGSGVTVTATTASDSAIGGTACTAGVDYISAAPVLVFSGGQTSQDFNITLCNDTVFEDFENFNVTLGSATGGLSLGSPSTAAGTINNDDNEPTYTVDNVTQNEGNSGTTNFAFTVTKNGSSQINTSIGYQTVDGTASSGTDYQSALGTLNFAPNETTQTVTVLVNGDTVDEPNETFFVTLGSIGTRGVSAGVGTIVNDDSAVPTVNLSIAPSLGSEEAQTQFTATVTASAPVSGNQTVNFNIVPATFWASADDFTAIPATITIPSGTASGSVTFSVVDDSDYEDSEFAQFSISSPSSGIALGGTTFADVTIEDNDDLQSPTITYTPLEATNSLGNRSITPEIDEDNRLAVGTFGPRIYYRKGSGAYVSNSCDFNEVDFVCTIDYSLLSGGAAAGDTISYFIVAQDEQGNIGSSPEGITGSSVNSITIPPGYAPNAYSIGTSSVASGNYTVLSLNAATLTGNVTVEESLRLNGIVNNSGFTMTLNPLAVYTRNSGYIIGNVERRLAFVPVFNMPDGVANTFTYPVGTASGYSPVTATFTSFNSGDSLSVFAKEGTQPSLSSTTTLQRYWTVTENGNITADLTFSYNQSDVSGNEANYQVIRVESGTPGFYTPSSINTTANTFTASNVSTFSDWTLGENLLAPTAADGVISGRVTNTNFRGLENVTVTLSGGALVQPIVVYTNQTGRFRFTEVPTGEIYTITVSSKRHRFAQSSTALSVSGNTENVNFVGEGW